MADPRTKPVLELETLDSYVVRIDGVAHKLRAPDALPAFAYKRLQTLSRRYNELWVDSELETPQEQQEFSLVLDEYCRIALDAPPDVHAKLTDMQRMAVLQAFQQLPTKMLRVVVQQQTATGAARAPQATTAQRKRNGAKPTGASSRRASAGSTAATRGTGSQPSRSASSAPVTS